MRASNLFPTLIIILTATINISGQTAQNSSLWVADMEVRLGMSEVEVTRKLLENYTLTPLGKGSYVIVSRRRNSRNEFETYGVVGFTSNRLSFASKNWHPNHGSDIQLAEAIYSVISEIQGRGERVLDIRTSTQRGPEFKAEEVELQFPSRRVEISLTQYKGSRSVQVTESIRLR